MNTHHIGESPRSGPVSSLPVLLGPPGFPSLRTGAEVAEVKELLKGKNLSSEIEAERKEERKHSLLCMQTCEYQNLPPPLPPPVKKGCPILQLCKWMFIE